MLNILLNEQCLLTLVNKHKETIMSFSKGDVVKLKSGGPEMTVVEVDDEECFCRWFDSKGQQMSDNFEQVGLEKVERNKPMGFRTTRA